MLYTTNWQLSKIHLTNLNLNNFKTFEAMGFKIIASSSPWIVSHAYQIL
jgi:hypothetical protein